MCYAAADIINFKGSGLCRYGGGGAGE